MTRIAFTGGRYYGRQKQHEPGTTDEAIWQDHDRVQRECARHDVVMNDILDRLVMTRAAVGDAPGLDALVRAWCRLQMIPVDEFKADWNRLGRAAGPERNGRMLREFRPSLLVAFPGGAGTADCTRQAEALGIEVIKINH